MNLLYFIIAFIILIVTLFINRKYEKDIDENTHCSCGKNKSCLCGDEPIK